MSGAMKQTDDQWLSIRQLLINTKEVAAMRIESHMLSQELASLQGIIMTYESMIDSAMSGTPVDTFEIQQQLEQCRVNLLPNIVLCLQRCYVYIKYSLSS